MTTAANPKTAGWQQLIREQAQQASPDGIFIGPIIVAVVFRFPRPASLVKRVRHHVTKPDIDKLLRACLDGLSGVLFADDRAVVDARARKVYVLPPAVPGADITVGEALAPEPEQTAFALFEEMDCTP